MIRKALIPTAGLGSRLRPLSSVLPKALLPLPYPRGGIRPAMHFICAEAVSAGIGEIALIVSPSQQKMLEDYFRAASQAGDRDLPAKIEFIVQDSPRGFGDAVLRGEKFIGDEPFLLLLGDHVYLQSPASPSCAAQVAEAFAAHPGAAMTGMQIVGTDELCRVGVATGEPINKSVYRCTAFVEKPDPATAGRSLRTIGLGEGRYLGHCGIYAFSQEIFRHLRDLSGETGPSGELELASAQSLLLQKHPQDYYLCRIDGAAYDIGTPECYTAAFLALLNAAGSSC